MFNRLNGSDEILAILLEQKFFIWKFRELFKTERDAFLEKRQKYLLY